MNGKPYTEISGLLPPDAVLHGVGNQYPVDSKKVEALSGAAKEMLVKLGMVPKDEGTLSWLGLIKGENASDVKKTPIYAIKVTAPFVREHYGE